MLNHDFINKLLKYDSLSYCSFCDYSTEQRAKYDRHLTTIKHKIAVSGIQCCGLSYYNKHQWINHKKSSKHRSIGTNFEPFAKPTTKKTVNLTRKPETEIITTSTSVVAEPPKITFKRREAASKVDEAVEHATPTEVVKKNKNIIKKKKKEDATSATTGHEVVATEKKEEVLLDIQISGDLKVEPSMLVQEGVTAMEVAAPVTKKLLWKKVQV